MKKIKSYSIHAEPSKNLWWLALELEDGSKPDGLPFSSAAELDAMLNILRHTRTAVFIPDIRAIETAGSIPGELAGESRE